MFWIVCTTGYGPDENQQQRDSFGNGALYIHKQLNMEKRKTQEEKQDKNIADTGIIYYLSFRAFPWGSLGNAKNVIKYIVPRPGIIQSPCGFSGFEPGTFRSSVWRSPNWAISATDNTPK